MLIPHIKFIETLIISKKDPNKVVETLDDFGLTFNEEAIAVMYGTLTSEAPDYFSGKEPADPDWIREMDIVEGFCHFTNFSFPGDVLSLKGAIDLLNDPLMYRLITSMALAMMNDEDIELIVNGKYNMSYTAEDIKMFLKYFFRVSE